MKHLIPIFVVVLGFAFSASAESEELYYLRDTNRYPSGQHALGFDWESLDPTLVGLRSGKLGRKPASIDDRNVLERSYDGGRDEQPLTVQEDLPRPTKYWTHQMVYREVVREIEDEKLEAANSGGDQATEPSNP